MLDIFNDFLNSAIITYAIIWFIQALIMMGVCIWLAGEKGRDKVAWAMLGIILGFVAVIALGLSPSKPINPSVLIARAKRDARKALVVECCGYNAKKLAEIIRVLSGLRGDKEATELLRKLNKFSARAW